MVSRKSSLMGPPPSPSPPQSAVWVVWAVQGRIRMSSCTHTITRARWRTTVARQPSVACASTQKGPQGQTTGGGYHDDLPQRRRRGSGSSFPGSLGRHHVLYPSSRTLAVWPPGCQHSGTLSARKTGLLIRCLSFLALDSGYLGSAAGFKFCYFLRMSSARLRELGKQKCVYSRSGQS